MFRVVFLKSFALSFIVSIFGSFFYAQWYCSASSYPLIARTSNYHRACSDMTTGLAPMFGAFILLLPITSILFFILFKRLKGDVSNNTGKVVLGLFVVTIIIILYSIGILRFPF